MKCWICVQCGQQFAASAAPPPSCPICEDDRQYVRWDGQAWTDRDELARTHRLNWRDDLGVVGIGVEPSFAIGQRALLIQEADGCVMWDCTPQCHRATGSFFVQLGPAGYEARQARCPFLAHRPAAFAAAPI
jgi:hypothetical protein